jgi:hypothetical protein
MTTALFQLKRSSRMKKGGEKLKRIYLFVVDFDKILVQIVLLIEALRAEFFQNCI